MDLSRKLVVDCLLKVEKSGFSNLVLSSELDSHKLSAQDKASAKAVVKAFIKNG